MNSLIKFNGNGKNVLFPESPILFDDFITRDFFNLPSRNVFKSPTIPSVNIKETESDFELEMAVPGVSKKDIKIELLNEKLTISLKQEFNNEEKTNDGKYAIKEFSYHSFSRSFQLPENSINDEEIKANYTDGILHILIPKKEPTKSKHFKEISVS